MKGLIEFEHVRLKKERDAYKAERDTLIEDITRLRAERDQYLALAKDYKAIFNYKVECNPGNMNYKKLKQKIDEVLKNEK